MRQTRQRGPIATLPAARLPAIASRTWTDPPTRPPRFTGRAWSRAAQMDGGKHSEAHRSPTPPRRRTGKQPANVIPPAPNGHVAATDTTHTIVLPKRKLTLNVTK